MKNWTTLFARGGAMREGCAGDEARRPSFLRREARAMPLKPWPMRERKWRREKEEGGMGGKGKSTKLQEPSTKETSSTKLQWFVRRSDCVISGARD
jgi:hypothetical protein